MKNRPVARDFFKTHLPAPLQKIIDFSTLKKQPADFIDGGYNKHYVDSLYGVETTIGYGYLYLLTEHQRTPPDKYFLLRLYTYVLRIIEQHLKSGGQHFPLVLPLVYCNAKKTIDPRSLRFWDYFEHPEQARRLMWRPPQLVDTHEIPDARPVDSWASLMELILKYAHTGQDFLPHINYLAGCGNFALIYRQGGRQYLTAMLESALIETDIKDKGALDDTLRAALPELRGNMMNLLQREHNEGLQKGLKLGEKKAKNLLQREHDKGLQKGLKLGEKKAKNLLQREHNEGLQKGLELGEKKAKSLLQREHDKGLQKGLKLGEKKTKNLLQREHDEGLQKGIELGKKKAKNLLQREHDKGLQKGLKLGEKKAKNLLQREHDEGLQKGLQLGQQKIVTHLLAKGYTSTVIADMTGLPLETVEMLQTEQ